MARVLLPIPNRDFDPTEAAVPWKLLAAAGHDVVLVDRSDLIAGPLPLQRDAPEAQACGFAVLDECYVSARWPDDAHRLVSAFTALLGGAAP